MMGIKGFFNIIFVIFFEFVIILELKVRKLMFERLICNLCV